MAFNTNLVLVLDNIRSTHNVGSIFRTADVFGVSKIYICGYTPAPKHLNDMRLPHIANKIHNQIHKTALGAEITVPFEVYNTLNDSLVYLKENKFTVASLEQAANSISIDAFKPPTKLALILGNELSGVNSWTISISDVILEIKQYGTKESLNVAAAAAIAMYAIRNPKIKNG